jgi:hypothetical protein
MKKHRLVGLPRTYPAPTQIQLRQLSKIGQTIDPSGLAYWPCQATLRSGQKRLRVYVVDAEQYIDVVGVWPDEDRSKRELAVVDVSTFSESPVRIPADLAEVVRSWQGRDETTFKLVLRDGRAISCRMGQLVDFPPLPKGVTGSDVVAVERASPTVELVPQPPYWWCLLGESR